MKEYLEPTFNIVIQGQQNIIVMSAAGEEFESDPVKNDIQWVK